MFKDNNKKYWIAIVLEKVTSVSRVASCMVRWNIWRHDNDDDDDVIIVINSREEALSVAVIRSEVTKLKIHEVL